MKLTKKHLAPYLPYDLHCSTEHGWTTMESLNDFCINVDHEESYSFEDHPDQILEFKPILHPLSRLDEEIEHKGERFVPNEWLKNEAGYFEIEVEEGKGGDVRFLDRGGNQHIFFYQDTFQKLYEWHFDTQGLIDKELAVKK